MKIDSAVIIALYELNFFIESRTDARGPEGGPVLGSRDRVGESSAIAYLRAYEQVQQTGCALYSIRILITRAHDIDVFFVTSRCKGVPPIG
jgi:hypothetical protein